MGKYDKVTINGETKTLWQWSLDSGVDYLTLRARVDHGCAPSRLLRPANKRRRLTSSKTGYTEQELYKLYLRFADNPNAMRILADFACAPTLAHIKPLYLKFREKRRNGEVE